MDEFTKDTGSGYQQVIDLIKRYERLDAAIVASNASTYIETCIGKYTVAGAIALRNRLKGDGIYCEEGCFEEKLIDALKDQYNNAIQIMEQRNTLLEQQAENMRMSILGRETKTRDEKPLEVVSAYIRENTMEMIDPLGAEKKIQELNERNETLINELNTKIKISNATTTIEF